MQMTYGSYSWQANSAEIVTGSKTLYDAGGLPYVLQCSIKVSGALSATSQIDADAKSNALIAALATPFQDFLVTLDNGNPSSIRLLNSTSISGVKVSDGPNFPKGTGAEYVTYRTYNFTIEAEYPHPALSLINPLGQNYLNGYGGGGQSGPGDPFGVLAASGSPPGSGSTFSLPSSNVTVLGNLSYGNQTSLPGGLIPGQFTSLIITAFQETVSTAGGGPVYAYLPALNGPPQKQLIYPVSVAHGTQTGTATGFQDYPQPPAPLWPDYLKTYPPRIIRRNPKRVGVSYRDFTIEWAYEYEASGPLIGQPSWWPG
jgi:hypothetical protein